MSTNKRLFKGFFLSCMVLTVVAAQNLSAEEEPEGAVAQTESAPGGGLPSFGFGVNIGTDVLPTPGGLPGETSQYTRLGFKPDFGMGKFGIGLDLTLRMKLTFGSKSTPEIYAPDWIWNYDNNGTTFFDVYLPKFLYVRYGKRGEDPFYAKLGSIDDLTLGNGFIVGNYSNTLFLPGRRVFGLQTGLDGNLFGFPYAGLEVLTGNLAQFDVMGGRFFVRPLAWMEQGPFKALQIGASIAMDRDPFAWTDPSLKPAIVPGSGQVLLYGLDFVQPILPDPFSLAVFGDVAFQPKRFGSMLGMGGRLFSTIIYGAQLRFLGPGFVPGYIDSNYDLFRADKYLALQQDPTGDFFAGWLASLGFSVLGDQVSFLATMDGPFKPLPDTLSANVADYPHMRATFHVAEALLAGFGFEAKYEKYFLGSDPGKSLWNDFVTPENAVIGAKLSYKMGTAIIYLVYDIKYNPAVEDNFEVSSSIQADLKF